MRGFVWDLSILSFAYVCVFFDIVRVLYEDVSKMQMWLT